MMIVADTTSYPPEGTVFSGQPNATVPTAQFALSPDGRSIVFVAAAPGLKPTLWVRPLEDVEARQLPGTEDAYQPFWSPDVGAEGYYSDFRLSPDQGRLAASLVDPIAGVPDIWLTDLARGGTSRFTFGPAINASPFWSPDGERIVFRTNRKGLIEFYQKGAAGGGSDEPLLLEEAQRASWFTPKTMIRRFRLRSS